MILSPLFPALSSQLDSAFFLPVYCACLNLVFTPGAFSPVRAEPTLLICFAQTGNCLFFFSNN